MQMWQGFFLQSELCCAFLNRLKPMFELSWRRLRRKMKSQSDEENRSEPAKKHFVKPLLLAQNSFHVPSHVLLPRGSLFAHPYPESVHPFETHEQLSLSALRGQTIAERNHLKSDANSSQRTGECGKQGENNNVYKSRGPREEKNTAGDFVKSIPVLPFNAAVVCLILNIIIPGSGKWILCVFMGCSILSSYVLIWQLEIPRFQFSSPWKTDLI